MEANEYLPAGFWRAGNPHCVPEKDAGAGGDQFAVEDLLDFSNKEEEGEEEEEEEEFGRIVAGSDEGGSDGAVGNSTDSSTVTAVDSCGNSLSGFEQHFHKGVAFRSIPDASLSDDLCEPQYDELAELEMAVSNFEDSFSTEDLHKLHLINGVNSASSSSSSSATVTAAGSRLAEDSVGGGEKQVTTFRPEAPVRVKARSKRSRVASCKWSSRLLAVSKSAFVSPSPDTELIAPPGPGARAPPKKAAKRKEPAGLASADGRRCLHCQTDKTPQWRTGPMGPKTLCNACGVRFKSGRLVPEYRPAASPTFVVSQHSNSHRKVLELRRQKELDQLAAPPVGPAALFDTLPVIPPASFLIQGPDIRHLI
ncbi:LOW QUALITY PROTEIN: GATA transcription factor 9-like [Curcuma longa]|uniref:LOW QUALITY PROTEIN: GATA transcription factor 9-like n=1 Tax=Curcuma longa TaxID=136217 RepID=UPI003D9F37E5